MPFVTVILFLVTLMTVNGPSHLAERPGNTVAEVPRIRRFLVSRRSFDIIARLIGDSANIVSISDFAKFRFVESFLFAYVTSS